MAYFPQINSAGVLTQRPYNAGMAFQNTVVDMQCGKRHAWAWRGAGLTGFPTRALGRWTLNYAAITNAEVDVLRAFYESMRGRWGQFSYLDPHGNLIPNSEVFSDGSWTRQTLTVGSAVDDPFGGNRATRMTGNGSNSMMYATVLPSGNASGYILNASVWLRPQYNGSIFMAFIDSGFGILTNNTFTLAGGKWTRVELPITLATDSYIRVLIGGGGTWGTSAVVDVFGAQCNPCGAAGGYMRSPGKPGLFDKCRFDTDTFNPRYIGPNESSLTLPIVEFN